MCLSVNEHYLYESFMAFQKKELDSNFFDISVERVASPENLKLTYSKARETLALARSNTTCWLLRIVYSIHHVAWIHIPFNVRVPVGYNHVPW